MWWKEVYDEYINRQEVNYIVESAKFDYLEMMYKMEQMLTINQFQKLKQIEVMFNSYLDEVIKDVVQFTCEKKKH